MTYIKGENMQMVHKYKWQQIVGLCKTRYWEPSIEKNMNRLPNIGKSDLNAKTWESNPQKIQQ